MSFAKSPRARFASITSVVVALAVGSLACGGKVVFDPTGSGGAGGTSTHSSTNVTSSKSTTNVGTTTSVVQSSSFVATTQGPQVGTSVGPSSSTGSGGCDTGQIGDPNGPLCNGCVNCAENSICAGELNACNANPDCNAWINCAQNCSSQQCYAQCQMQHPQGAMIYQGFIDCLLCSACPNNCNVPQACPPNP